MLKKDENDMLDLLNIINKMRSSEPSKNKVDYWIQYYTENDYKRHTDKGGKWLIFCSREEVDTIWSNIKKAQDKGVLGNITKVSTAFKKNKDNNHVICVYTYDSTDKDDVLRVRLALRDLGFTDILNYKRDIETINGVYGSDNEFLLKV